MSAAEFAVEYWECVGGEVYGCELLCEFVSRGKESLGFGGEMCGSLTVIL